MKPIIKGAAFTLSLALFVILMCASENHAQTPDPAARGKALYQGHCASCHGISGAGNGMDATGMNPAPTNLTSAQVMGAISDNDIEQAILAGVPNSAMHGYGTILSPDEVAALKAYVRSLSVTQ